MRRTARENAFKLIFEKSVSGGTGDITYAVLTHSLTPNEKQYFDLLISDVEKNKDRISKIIKKYSHAYALDRIYKIDLSILYIGICEILYNQDVPDKVAVNEALELSKIYSTDNSPSFINGILASVIRDKEILLNDEEEKNEENCLTDENNESENN